MFTSLERLVLYGDLVKDKQGKIFLCDHLNSHQVVPHDKAISVLKAALAFYETHTPEQIDAHNKAADIAWAEQMTADDIESLKASKQAKRKKAAGYVYILKASTGHYKIGRTSNPKNRKKMIGILLPFEVETLCIIATDDMYIFEAALHEKFADQHVNGEWFKLDTDDVEYLKALAR